MSKADRTADIDGFIDIVDMAASNYWPTKSLQDRALPATVRDEIKAADQACRRLIDRVNKLGGTSRYLLYSEGGSGNHERFWNALNYITEQLGRARQRADNLSKSGGAPRNHARIQLAAMVAHAIKTRLEVKPTTTWGGLFEKLLKTVIEAVEGRSDPSVRDLLRAALRTRVTESPDGIIEIDPRVE